MYLTTAFTVWLPVVACFMLIVQVKVDYPVPSIGGMLRKSEYVCVSWSRFTKSDATEDTTRVIHKFMHLGLFVFFLRR